MRCLHLQSKSKEIRSTTAARTLLVTSQPAISSSGKQQTGSSTFGGCCSISHSFISNAFCHNSTHYSSQSQSTVQNMEGELGFLSLFFFCPDRLCLLWKIATCYFVFVTYRLFFLKIVDSRRSGPFFFGLAINNTQDSKIFKKNKICGISNSFFCNVEINVFFWANPETSYTHTF